MAPSSRIAIVNTDLCLKGFNGGSSKVTHLPLVGFNHALIYLSYQPR